MRRAGTPAAGSFRSSRGYYWTARSVPGQEQCWGVQRIENGNVVSVLARGATNVTFAPGNLLHTLTITKSGAVMNMTLRRMGVIIAEQSWTDPAGSLQPGFIGLMQGGINTVGFDNLQIIDVSTHHTPHTHAVCYAFVRSKCTDHPLEKRLGGRARRIAAASLCL